MGKIGLIWNHTWQQLFKSTSMHILKTKVCKCLSILVTTSQSYFFVTYWGWVIAIRCSQHGCSSQQYWLLIEYLPKQSGSRNQTVFSEPKVLSSVTIFSLKMPIFTKVEILGKSIIGFQKFFWFWILYTQILYISVKFWMMFNFLIHFENNPQWNEVL